MKAAILSNGTPGTDAALLTEIKAADLIVCADGAAGWAAEAGIHPHTLIGDMDSIAADLPAKFAQAGVEVITLEREKDLTDTEAAVELALMRGADEFLIAGGTGGRLDHTMGNILLLVKLTQQGKKAVLAGEGQRVIAASGEAIIHGRAGDTVSIIPFGEDIFIRATSGLQYPVHCRSISPNTTLGISNVMTRRTSQITIERGTAIIIHQRQ
jgi:thiamine pyrophosphokinase